MRNSIFCLTAAALLHATGAPAADPAVTCEAGKLKVASSYPACLLKADAVALKKGVAPDYTDCVEKYDEKFQAAEDKAAGACPTEGDAADVRSFLDACSAGVSEALETGDLISDPITCNEDLDECGGDLDDCGGDLSNCSTALAACESAPPCLSGIAGNWTVSLPDASPSPDSCELAFDVTSAQTVATTIANCGYLGGADGTGTLTGDTATTVQDISPICSGYRLEASLTFSSCSSGSGTYRCLDGIGGTVVFTGSVTATRTNAVCGDGTRNSVHETCDGTDLDSKDCSDFGFDAGTLACSGTCELDTSGCFECPSPGIVHNGACWFLSPPATSCAQVCSAASMAYDPVTASIAEQAPNNDACNEMLDLFGAPNSGITNNCGEYGCALYRPTGMRGRCLNYPTTPTGSASGIERVCACKN